MNKYLEKIAGLLSREDKQDLENTAGIMGIGTITGAVGNHINQHLGLGSEAAHAVKPKFFSKGNLAAAGVLGVLGGVGDYAALKMHRKIEKEQKERL